MEQELEDRVNEEFRKRVPSMGKCETVGGEILRAVTKIGYRSYNDGDNPTKGYGVQTSGAALAYLMNSGDVPDNISKIADKFASDCEGSPEYVKDLKSFTELTEAAVKYCEDGSTLKNSEDMYDYDEDAEDMWKVQTCQQCGDECGDNSCWGLCAYCELDEDE